MLSALAIAHHDDYDPGLVGAAAQQHGYQLEMVAREEFTPGATLPDPRHYDLIIPFGSAWSAVSDHADEVAAEQRLLRVAHEAQVPIFGVCFGGQQLAAALGGHVRRAAQAEIGWYLIESHHDSIGAGPWMQFHLDEFVPPADAEILARTTSVQAFRLGRSLGLQFHPEVTRATIERWIDDGGHAYLGPLGLTVDEVFAQCDLHAAEAPGRAAALFSAFIDSLPEAAA